MTNRQHDSGALRERLRATFRATGYVTNGQAEDLADAAIRALSPQGSEPAGVGYPEYVIGLLVAGGYVTQAKVDEARSIALGLSDVKQLAPAPAQPEGGDAARGSAQCPLCQQSGMHRHSGAEIASHRIERQRRRVEIADHDAYRAWEHELSQGGKYAIGGGFDAWLAARDYYTRPAPAQQAVTDGYRKAFYEISGMLGIPAPQAASPREVYETQIKPRIASLCASQLPVHVKASAEFLLERLEHRRCDSDAVSDCVRCNAVVAARHILGIKPPPLRYAKSALASNAEASAADAQGASDA